MPFNWLNKHYKLNKSLRYAEKTLAAYELGIRAGGSIRGVRIQAAEGSCQAAKGLPSNAVYHPQEAPHLPLPQCTRTDSCPCVYRPVMSYEVNSDPNEEDS
jgi:hypothetical protein